MYIEMIDIIAEELTKCINQPGAIFQLVTKLQTTSKAMKVINRLYHEDIFYAVFPIAEETEAEDGKSE